MTREELLTQVMRGRLLIVGEFRGAYAESAGFVDQRTGEAISYVRAIYLIECACRGLLNRAIIRQKRIGAERPEDVQFSLEKGKFYVFFLNSFNLERGAFSGWMADREPELIEMVEEAVCAPSGALPPPNLVHLETTPQGQ